ncbi:MAG: magnesium transporter CorA family protein [Candidatus Uhrbacteria bacterium]
MITIYRKKSGPMEQLEAFEPGTWIHIEEPSDEEITLLVQMLDLEEDLLRDALDPFEVPRLEVEDRTRYVFTRMPYTQEDGRTFTLPLLIIIGKDFFCTFAKKPFGVLTRFLDDDLIFDTTKHTQFFLEIINEANYIYKRHLNDIGKRVRGMSVRVRHIGAREIEQFVTYEEVLNDFLSALAPTHATLEKLLTGKELKLYEEDADIIEDLLPDYKQLLEFCKATLKTIQNIRDAYSTLATHQLNRVMKLLTALTILLAVPTLIASVYGMNVPLPYANNSFAFFGILIGILVSTLALFGIFTKNRWL